MCNHEVCQFIVEKREEKELPPDCGVGVLPVVDYNRKGRMAAMLAKERFGDWASQFNVCFGCMESTDCGCVIKAMLRVLSEKLKIRLNSAELMKHFVTPFNNNFRFVLKNGIAIFVGDFQGYGRRPLNQKIRSANCKPSIELKFREIEQVEWFWMDNLSQIEGNQDCVISDIAKSVVKSASKI